jgi:hypothetical protein
LIICDNFDEKTMILDVNLEMLWVYAHARAIRRIDRSTSEVCSRLDVNLYACHPRLVNGYSASKDEGIFGSLTGARPCRPASRPHLDQLLGPAKTVKEVLDSLDRQYRAQGRPAVWFLPLNEPIAPHLDELLGKLSR